jgi:UDP-N-acetylmuramyl pentapeptide phosphotransferase/UDP-N-acetylglucosamine-1-phosphate transferase
MMGDSGSNMLGAALGLTVALNTNLAFQWVIIALIAALHVYSEQRSVNEFIERNPILRTIDRRLGVR